MEMWQVWLAIGGAIAYVATGIVLATWSMSDVAGQTSVRDSLFILMAMLWPIVVTIAAIAHVRWAIRNRAGQG